MVGVTKNTAAGTLEPMKKKCIIIHGPTGVGKSDAAVELALTYGGHIINGDVGQFYTPLSIGTAKPNWRAEKVPHHLFDIIDTPHSYTVVEYRALVLEKMEELWAQNKLPIIVGGSGFYLKSLFFPPHQDEQASTQTVAQEVSWQQLLKLDPERAQSIDPQDTYRLSRAFALLEAGKKPSAYKPVYKGLDCDVLVVWFKRDRPELYTRINERVGQMMQAGWLEEVQQLIGTQWEPFLQNKKIIGYDLLHAYLTGQTDLSLEQTTQLIAQKTRNYAKRQHTFWRMMKEQLASHIVKPSCIAEISLSLQDSYTSLNAVVSDFIKETE